jgi:AraC-like DNA-binding protein
LHFFKELKQKLQELMENEKPYLDQDLNILKISKFLNTNTKYISHVINNEFGQNFINFINKYRIEDVKELLINNNQTFTIEALAQSVGFKSKSAFNSAFKKYTGTTPSNFIKDQVTI